MQAPIFKGMVAAVLAGSLAACAVDIVEFEPDVLVGTWYSEPGPESQSATLELGYDLSGRATFQRVHGGALEIHEFTVDAVVLELDLEYEIEMSCGHHCSSSDFVLRCVMEGVDVLSCSSSDGGANGYAMSFRRG